MAPGRSIHAATPVTGAAVEGNSSLMQRQPVCGTGGGAGCAPADACLYAPEKPAIGRRSCQEYEEVAVNAYRSNNCLK